MQAGTTTKSEPDRRSSARLLGLPWNPLLMELHFLVSWFPESSEEVGVVEGRVRTSLRDGDRPNKYRPLKGRPTFDSTLRVSNGPNRSPNGEPVVMPILLPVSGLLLLSSRLDCHSNSIVTAERSEGGEAGGTKSKDPVQCHERSLPQHSIGFQMRSSTNRASASHGSAHHGTLANLLETP